MFSIDILKKNSHVDGTRSITFPTDIALEEIDRLKEEIGVPDTPEKRNAYMGLDLQGVGVSIVGLGFAALKRGGIAIVPGGVLIGIGVVISYYGYRLSNYADQLDTMTSYRLIDPNKLRFLDSEIERTREHYYLLDSDNQRSRENYHLIDEKERKEFFEKMNESLNREMDSVKELNGSLRDGRENQLGQLADRGLGERGFDRRSDSRSQIDREPRERA